MMKSSPWSRAECLAFDLHLQRDCQIPASLLMENAGASLAVMLRSLLRKQGSHRVLFLLGPGNNGGDGLVAARQLQEECEILLHIPLSPPAISQSPSLTALEGALGVGLSINPSPLAGLLRPNTLVVDALFGIGLSRPLEGAALSVVQMVNASGLPVVSVDIPSGLDADSGLRMGDAIRAGWTLSFPAPKSGFLLADGPGCCGTVQSAGIGVSRAYTARWLHRHRTMS